MKILNCIVAFCSVTYISAYVGNLAELELDKNGHLASHWILVPEGPCGEKMTKNYFSPSGLRNISTVSNEIAVAFGLNGKECKAVCLGRGVPFNYIIHPLPESIYHESTDGELNSWVSQSCDSLEVGFISYHPNPSIVYWISHENQKIPINSNLEPGEFHTFWTNTHLGHSFLVVDKVTKEELGTYTAYFNSFFSFGDSGTFVNTEIGNEEDGVSSTLNGEFFRSRRIKRTFTEFGFSKGRLPEDLWASMQTYYYNNQMNYVREEYENKGLTVNWYEVDPLFLGMPWGLKGYWQTRLLTVVQNWIGNVVQLENTDIYGMRRYENGARLLTHVDRESTHAVSLIVNIAQSNIRKPWMVEIYDHADRLHEIEMEPGDIVYYESARCLHGRMTPLEGDYYVNLFTHYRPIGDSQWFMKPNSVGSPEPLIDITGIDVPTLSPSGHVVKSANDLFEFWKSVSPPKKINPLKNEL